MKETQDKKKKINILKILLTIIFVILLIGFVIKGPQVLRKSNEVFVVTDGALYYEEPSEGYVIRDEIILQGESYKNGMVKVISDGERAAKNQIVFE